MFHGATKFFGNIRQRNTAEEIESADKIHSNEINNSISDSKNQNAQGK